MVMQSSQDRMGEYAANRLDPARDRRILVQGACLIVVIEILSQLMMEAAA
jgi:hypothetical protein